MAAKVRLIALGLALAGWCGAATLKLYLKDGTYQIAREYKVEQDRVRYYSTERSDWEELPLEMVDLKKTEAESKRIEEERKQEAAVSDAEEKAEREARREVEKVPVEAGTYLLDGEAIKPLKQAEIKVQNDKRRNVLKVLSPLPVITGKSTVDIDGEKASFVVTTSERPEFYFRLNEEERFAIVKLTPGKGVRVVERLTVIPVSKEIVEERDEVPLFRRQVGEGLYKIWPTKPIEAGEYAVIQFTEGKVNLQVWDFSYRPGGK